MRDPFANGYVSFPLRRGCVKPALRGIERSEPPLCLREGGVACPSQRDQLVCPQLDVRADLVIDIAHNVFGPSRKNAEQPLDAWPDHRCITFRAPARSAARLRSAHIAGAAPFASSALRDPIL